MITWKISNERLFETSDELEAMETSIYNMLKTACGEFDIYSWNFGNQLLNILGSDEIETKIEEYIESCLLNDDRIESVEDLTYQINGDEIEISFKVTTNFGTITSEVIL